jgi:hypothetical protein
VAGGDLTTWPRRQGWRPQPSSVLPKNVLQKYYI